MGQLWVGVELCITHLWPVFRAAGGSWDQGYDYNAWGGGYAGAGYGGGGAYGGGGYGAPVSLLCAQAISNAFVRVADAVVATLHAALLADAETTVEGERFCLDVPEFT